MRFAFSSLRTARFVLVLCILCCVGPALAQEAAPAGGSSSDAPGYPECTTKPTEGDTAAAKGAFQAGTAAYNEADYPRAITYWEDAFRRDCTATALLLNLARAYESSTQFDKAIVALRTFNERNADSPQHDQIERRIERLEEQLKAQQSQVASPPTQATPTAEGPPPASPKPAQQHQASTEPNKWPLVIAITGGVFTVVGTAGYFKAKADENNIVKPCGGDRGNCTPDQAAEGNKAISQQKGATALAIGGAVIGIGGGIWYALEVQRANREAAKQQAGVHFIPLVSPDFAGLSLDGRF